MGDQQVRLADELVVLTTASVITVYLAAHAELLRSSVVHNYVQAYLNVPDVLEM